MTLVHCTECGSPEAIFIKEIRYPKGTTTQLLDCPLCKRIVIQAQK